MKIRVYNLLKNESFELEEDVTLLGNILSKELEVRMWNTNDCKVEMLDDE